MFHSLLAIIYISFISLGLPDGMLGAAGPTMGPELGAPVSYGFCYGINYDWSRMCSDISLIVNHISVAFMPVYLLFILVLIAVMYEKMIRKVY